MKKKLLMMSCDASLSTQPFLLILVIVECFVKLGDLTDYNEGIAN